MDAHTPPDGPDSGPENAPDAGREARRDGGPPAGPDAAPAHAPHAPEPTGSADSGPRGGGGPGFPGAAGAPEGWGGGRVPSPGSVLFLLAGVAILFMLGGVLLQVLLGEAGLVLAQLGFLMAPALLFVYLGGYDPVRTLSLRLPNRRQLLGGVILLAGATPLAWFLAWAQAFVVEVPTEMLEAMSAFLVADDPLRLLWLLVMVAAVPAVAEETLFRGVVLSGLGSRFPAWVAILVCGLIFGLFHLAPGTAFRFLPTAWLGVVLAWVVWESRALLLGIFLHFVNNASILLLSVLPATREVTGDAEGAPPLLLLPLALAFLVLGARMVREGRNGAHAHPGEPPGPR